MGLADGRRAARLPAGGDPLLLLRGALRVEHDRRGEGIDWAEMLVGPMSGGSTDDAIIVLLRYDPARTIGPFSTEKRGNEPERKRPAAAQYALVGQPGRSGNDRALSGALSQFRPHARGIAVRQADHRHR